MNLVEKAQEIARSSVMLTEKGLAEDILRALTQARREGAMAELEASLKAPILAKDFPPDSEAVSCHWIEQRLSELNKGDQ